MADKSKPVYVTFDGDVAVLHMCNGENRFDLDFLDVLEAALDEVVNNDSVVALVTVGEGKFYSNGINLMDWLVVQDSITQFKFIVRYHTFIAKLLTFPLVTVAAINGHAFAGGMLMAMGHDYRVQNSHRGWISMNEIFLKARFPRFLLEVLRIKVPKTAWLETIVYGRRYTGSEAKAANLVDDVASDSSTTLQRAVELARQMASKGPFDRQAVTNLKQDLYQRALEHCYTNGYENYVTPWKHIISHL